MSTYFLLIFAYLFLGLRFLRGCAKASRQYLQEVYETGKEYALVLRGMNIDALLLSFYIKFY
jgi:hypothetical protein